MPFCQLLKTKEVSTTALASTFRAVTNKLESASHCMSPVSNARSTLAKPCASVLPDHRDFPLQSFTATSAPATGLPLSSEVTHTTLFSRPRLK